MVQDNPEEKEMDKGGNEPDSEMTGDTEFQGTSETQGKSENDEMSDAETQREAKNETEARRSRRVKKLPFRLTYDTPGNPNITYVTTSSEIRFLFVNMGRFSCDPPN